MPAADTVEETVVAEIAKEERSYEVIMDFDLPKKKKRRRTVSGRGRELKENCWWGEGVVHGMGFNKMGHPNIPPPLQSQYPNATELLGCCAHLSQASCSLNILSLHCSLMTYHCVCVTD